MARKRKETAVSMSPEQSLVEASAEIAQLHAGISTHLQRTLTDAIRIGELLCKAKDTCPHGEWEAWCKRELPFGECTRKWYLRFYLGKDQIGTGADLSIRQAKKLLTPPKPEIVTGNDAPDPAPAGPRTHIIETKCPTQEAHESGVDDPPRPPAQATGLAAQADEAEGSGPGDYPLPRTGAELWICRDAEARTGCMRPDLYLFPAEPKLIGKGRFVCGDDRELGVQLPSRVLWPEIKPGHAATCRMEIQLLTPPEDRRGDAEPKYEF